MTGSGEGGGGQRTTRAAPRRGSPGWLAFAGYLALSVLMTWPLATGLAEDVPGDLGDSLLNLWILGWGAEQIPRLLVGQIGLSDYWNANIFHPEPLALAFSEHLFGLVLQILPVYWLTGNLILCYNLLFLSSFALSGLGMFLLVRDVLTDTGGAADRGDRRGVVLAAFIAGLIFAFLPFRIAQIAHIQSLHAQWMPLALLGFRRYVGGGQWRALAGGSLALLMQHWSNGYYMLFFAPFMALFVVHQMWSAGRLGDARRWLGLGAAVVVIAAGTLPFVALYLEAQRVHALVRPFAEVVRFSADVYSYLTAPEALRLWGSVLQTYPKPEGELFFGAIPWLLAAIALLPLAGRGENHGRKMSALAWALLAIIVVQVIGVIAIVFTGGFITSFAGMPVRATNATRILIGIAILTVMLLTLSRPARQRALAFAPTSTAVAALLLLLGLWLSLGPLPQSQGRTLQGLGLYGVFYAYVPGFDGLRVPARYAMIAGVFLSLLAGVGAFRLWGGIWRRSLWPQWREGLVWLLAALFILEVTFAPMAVNVAWGDSGVTPPPHIETATNAPAVYHTLATMPADTAVAEFPFGDPAWELRYVYYATVHWKRLINGYSGAFPRGYRTRVALFQRVGENPEAAWRALRDAGATHVVVHTSALPPGEARVITQWLDDHFAVEIARFEGDLLYDVTGVWRPR